MNHVILIDKNIDKSKVSSTEKSLAKRKKENLFFMEGTQ